MSTGGKRTGPAVPRSVLPLAFLLTAAAIGVAAAGSAPAAKERAMPGRIVPGQGIGLIRLGMNGRKALATLRRYAAPVLIDVSKRRGGSLYIKYEYRQPNVYGSAAYGVALEGRQRGKRRVVLIETWLPAHRTPDGVGPRSTLSTLMRAYGRELACGLASRAGLGGGTTCALRDARGRLTVFYLPAGVSTPGETSPQRVSSVWIREPGAS